MATGSLKTMNAYVGKSESYAELVIRDPNNNGHFTDSHNDQY